MRKIWSLAIVAMLTLSLASCLVVVSGTRAGHHRGHGCR